MSSATPLPDPYQWCLHAPQMGSILGLGPRRAHGTSSEAVNCEMMLRKLTGSGATAPPVGCNSVTRARHTDAETDCWGMDYHLRAEAPWPSALGTKLKQLRSTQAVKGVCEHYGLLPVRQAVLLLYCAQRKSCPDSTATSGSPCHETAYETPSANNAELTPLHWITIPQLSTPNIVHLCFEGTSATLQSSTSNRCYVQRTCVRP